MSIWEHNNEVIGSPDYEYDSCIEDIEAGGLKDKEIDSMEDISKLDLKNMEAQ
jgi:hypothetical protein